jgi:hypothetical protein
MPLPGWNLIVSMLSIGSSYEPRPPMAQSGKFALRVVMTV